MNPDRPGAPSSGGRAHPVVPWKRIALYFLASRLFIYVIGNLSVYAIFKGPDDRARAPLSLDLFKRWDADWYLGIARDGYLPNGHGVPSSAFFPLYPTLIRFLHFLCHDYRVAGYLISNGCLLGSCLLLWKLAARDTSRETVADGAVLFFLFNPVSFFYSTIYSESLFFLLMIGTAWFASQRRWLAAGCCGYLGALTRPVGVLLISLLVVEFLAPHLERRRGKTDASRWPDPGAPAFLTAIVLTLAGLGTYCLCLLHRLDDPFAFLHAEAQWHRHFTLPLQTLLHIEYTAFYFVWMRAAVIIGLGLLVLGFSYRIRPAYSAMVGLYIVVYLSAGHLESLPRFLSVLFPVYLTLALLADRHPRLEPLLLTGSAMLLTLSVILFVNGYWYT